LKFCVDIGEILRQAAADWAMHHHQSGISAAAAAAAMSNTAQVQRCELKLCMKKKINFHEILEIFKSQF